MGDDEQGCARLGASGEEQVDDCGAGGSIEIAGRLVGEDQRGAGGQRAGDRHARLLAAGKLGRIVREPGAATDGEEVRLRALAGIIQSGEFQRGRDVFERGHRR